MSVDPLSREPPAVDPASPDAAATAMVGGSGHVGSRASHPRVRGVGAPDRTHRQACERPGAAQRPRASRLARAEGVAGRRDRPGAAVGGGFISGHALTPRLRVRISERDRLPTQRRVHLRLGVSAPSGRELARVPSHPVHFHLAAGGARRQTCDGSSDTFGFNHSGRVFQVEIYLGPRVGPAFSERVVAMLDSLRVAPAA